MRLAVTTSLLIVSSSLLFSSHKLTSSSGRRPYGSGHPNPPQANIHPRIASHKWSLLHVLDDYGRGTTAPQGERFKQTIFNGLNQFHLGFDPTSNSSAKVEIELLNVAYVDFFTLWNGVLGSDPGYQVFGYTNTGWCVNCTWEGCSTNGMCDDPEAYFEWIPG